MARRRFFVSRDFIRRGEATLSSDQAHHLRNVLRIGVGQVVEIFDGEGNGYWGEVALNESSVVIRNLHQIPPDDRRIPLILAAALIKPGRFEWLLEKATELGVDEIIPLMTLRSGIQIPDEKLGIRLKRWERIVLEASKQCGRSALLRIHRPRQFLDFIDRKENSSLTRLLFWERAEESWQPDPTRSSNGFVVCIGPEGGWDGGEVEQAKKAGYRIVRLGRQILRTETAALAAASIIQYQISHFGLHH